jgi:succinate dehydrogenase / fumarate reductase membrane anchor subunit
LSKALGQGSANTGLDHWLAQRSTAIAIVPLGLWFTISMVSLQHGSYELVAAWVAEPLNAILLILLVIAVVYHSMIGLQVIVEDYVSGGLGYLTSITLQFVHILLAVAGIYSIVVTSLGAGQ